MIKKLVLDKRDKIQILKWDNDHLFCGMCGEYIRIENTYKGLPGRCRDCVRFNRQCYYLANLVKTKEQVKKYDKKNKKNVILRRKNYAKSNRKKLNKYHRNYASLRRKNDPLYKLAHNLRTRLKDALKAKNFSKNNNFKKYIGCTLEFLKSYLEKQFKEKMSWENYGKWHIDHIIPLASAKTSEDMIKLCHYTNLQPLWALDNMKKGARYSGSQS